MLQIIHVRSKTLHDILCWSGWHTISWILDFSYTAQGWDYCCLACEWRILTSKGLATPMRTVPKAVLFRTLTAWARLAWLKSVLFTNINRSPGNKRPSLSAKPPATRERITITVCPGFMGSWESFRKWQGKKEREE